MVREELKDLSCEEIKDLMDREIPIEGVYAENLDLKDLSEKSNCVLDKKLLLRNSAFKKINMMEMVFNENVIIDNCIFGHANFKEMIFTKSFNIENCVFKKSLSLEYLTVEENLIINNVTFEEYVDFSPASFNGDVMISNCKFLKGTNLLSRLVTFEKEPNISNCEGSLKTYDDSYDDYDDELEVI